VWAPSWTGFYLGANVGGATGSDSFRYSPPLPVGIAGALRSSSGDFNYRGPFGGGTAGYNWQFNPTWVWGIEGVMDAAGISGGVNCGPGVLIHCSLKNNWIGTVRGRLGWTPGAGNSLWYVTGGAAFGDVNVSAPGVNHGATNTGWTAGAGWEYMFSPQWSVKVEYRHVDLGDISTTIPGTLTGLGVAATSRVNYNTDGALLGVNFHFNAPPPPPPPIVAPAPPPVAPKVFIVFFDWDKDTITPEGQAIIQQAADAWRSGAPVQIQVTGYTDRSV